MFTVGLVLHVSACSGGGGDPPPVFDAPWNTPDGPPGGSIPDGSPLPDADLTIYTDPQDTSTGDGDPSIDIEDLTYEEQQDSRRVCLDMWGPWPPSKTWYSWYCTLELLVDDVVVGSITTQRHNGVPGTFVEGIGQDFVTIEDRPDGPYFIWAGGPEYDSIRVECGIQKTEAGTRVTDEIGPILLL